jgi:UDP-N-acetylmuramate dehydrogenase
VEKGRRAITKDLTHLLAAAVSRLKRDEPLKDHTTFRIGGPARFFAEVQDTGELSRLKNLAAIEKIPFCLLGWGSNVLVSDDGFPGIVARLTGRFAEFRFERDVLEAGAGVPLPLLVNAARDGDLSGFECLAGIPGTLGGALVGNAGTMLGSVADTLVFADVLSDLGQIVRLEKKNIEFSYRHSGLAGRTVLGATFHLKKSQKNGIVSAINELMKRRSSSQPHGAWSAGSVFKNPPGDSAGKLIEACGLKGVAHGGAQISEKHANFIINTGSATAADVRALIALAQEKVKEQFSVDLELEIKLIGW